jgi:hypothetical protein
VLAVCCLGFALPAVAQLDSSALQQSLAHTSIAKSFHLPSGFDLIVD